MPRMREASPSSGSSPDSPAESASTPASASEALQQFLAEHGRRTPVEYGEKRVQSAAALLSRAARRRKLGVSKVHRNHRSITGGGRVVGGFAGHVTSLASDEADRAALSLPTVRALLRRAGLPVADGRSFAQDAADEGLAWFSSRETPVVVKPAHSQGGAGITRDVRGAEDFSAAWESAVSQRGETVGADTSVVVEQQVPGVDLRVFVVGEELVAAAARVPLFCLGDGRRTVGDLVEAAGRRRDEHPLCGAFSHDALAHARDAGLGLDETSEAGRPYLLGDDAAMRSGGVTVDVTDQLDEALRTLAIDAVWSVPGCKAAGVDLLVRDLESTAGAVVLDVDARAGFMLHHYPWMGRRRAVAETMVQQMSATARG